MEPQKELNKDTPQDQGNPISPKEGAESSSTYVKPYISVKKYGENGQLFEENFHDDRYKRNNGRNYH